MSIRRTPMCGIFVATTPETSPRWQRSAAILGPATRLIWQDLPMLRCDMARWSRAGQKPGLILRRGGVTDGPRPYRRAILGHLQKKGRATTLELSEAAGLSPSPCHRRQRLLEEAGVIQRYVALLDQERVGLPVSVFVTVELAEHSDQSLQRFETAVAD